MTEQESKSAADRPRMVTLFEAFLKLEHLRGRALEEIAADVQEAVKFIAQQRVIEKLSRIENMAVGKVFEFVNQGIVEEVADAIGKNN